MMDALMKEFHGIFLHYFGRETLQETHGVVVLCLLFGALALSRVSTTLGAVRARYTTGILLTAAGLSLIGVVQAALPQFGLDEWWMRLAAVIATVFVLVIPVTLLLQKGGYGTALIAWIVTLLVVAVILTLEPIAMKSISKSFGKVQQIETRRIQIENYK
jgi:phosphatidylserine synthase